MSIGFGDAVLSPRIGTIFYRQVNTSHGTVKGREAAGLLIDRQMAAVSALKAAGLTVKINTVVVRGVNENHIPFLAKRLQSLGVDLMNLIPLIPVPGTAMAELDPPHRAEMKKLRQVAGHYIPQMHHCRRCRSDAAGMLNKSHRPAE